MSIKIILADDHKIMRDGLRSLIEKQSDMTVVGEADNGRIALQLCQKLQPDIVVMDIGMPDLNGIEATSQIIGSKIATKVIALSMYSDKSFVSKMLMAGASGYLLKDCAVDELILAIKTVIENKVYISPAVAGTVIAEYKRYCPVTEELEAPTLTTREKEVLQLMAEGISTKKIASHLNVSIKTVETYRQQIMRKLNLFTVAELTKYAIREGITEV